MTTPRLPERIRADLAAAEAKASGLQKLLDAMDDGYDSMEAARQAGLIHITFATQTPAK